MQTFPHFDCCYGQDRWTCSLKVHSLCCQKSVVARYACTINETPCPLALQLPVRSGPLVVLGPGCEICDVSGTEPLVSPLPVSGGALLLPSVKKTHPSESWRECGNQKRVVTCTNQNGTCSASGSVINERVHAASLQPFVLLSIKLCQRRLKVLLHFAAQRERTAAAETSVEVMGDAGDLPPPTRARESMRFVR
jgi:hypothetical protein